MKGTERRLTIPNLDDEQNPYKMSKKNIVRLKNGYRHPFERIPPSYFNVDKQETKKKKLVEEKIKSK
jgi:hypothetical protein